MAVLGVSTVAQPNFQRLQVCRGPLLGTGTHSGGDGGGSDLLCLGSGWLWGVNENGSDCQSLVGREGILSQFRFVSLSQSSHHLNFS